MTEKHTLKDYLQVQKGAMFDRKRSGLKPDASNMTQPVKRQRVEERRNPFLKARPVTVQQSNTPTNSRLPTRVTNTDKHQTVLSFVQKDEMQRPEQTTPKHRSPIETQGDPYPTPTSQHSREEAIKDTTLSDTVLPQAEDTQDDAPTLLQSKPATFKTSRAKIPRLPPSVRYGHLIDPENGLPLAQKYALLESLASTLDDTVVYYKGQNMSCAYHKIKATVQVGSKRNFELTHLGQLMTVVPEHYVVRPVSINHEGQKINSLAIDFPTLGSSRESDSTVQSNLNVMTTKIAIERKRRLHGRLLDKMKQEHKKFLIAQDADNLVQTKKLRAWHPRFDVDSVPDIPCAELPQLDKPVVDLKAVFGLSERSQPSTKSHEQSQQKRHDLLRRIDAQLGKHSPRVQELSANTSASPSTSGDAKLPLQARSLQLLDRIRAKEQEKAKKIMYAPPPEVTERQNLLKTLPRVVETVQFLFTGEKRAVLGLQDVVRRLIDSLGMSMSEMEVTKHLHAMAKELPMWCEIVNPGSGDVLRVDTSMKLKDLKERLNALH
ncbi:hypothetical protein BZG36_03835 [Bifiguratus adelaidae]|uniref:CDT1 Geminin-binding domain-containing protein n=1 Tax=Bifiguratus adelaidae TaxID=1938954 RepID=A0A261XWA3_9FUNG|nr:hypothetical protein BZG36_03835 [Bifiguratus adelaidae]